MKLNSLGRNLGVEQIVGGGQRHAQHDQDRADQHHGFAHDLGQLGKGDLAVDEHLDDEHVDRRHGGSLGHGEIAAVDAAEHDEGQGQFPDRFAQRGQRFTPAEWLVRRLRAAVLPQAVKRQHDHDQQAGQDAGQEQVADRYRMRRC